MAASLVGGAAVGAAFGELLKAVLEIKDRAIMFKQTLAYLRTTLIAIVPVIKEIEQHNNELGRAKEELESLIKEMEEGTKLVYKCSKIHKLNFPARIRYQEQLVALVESLVRFFMIDMQAQTARDLKETLVKVRRIHSAVNKLPLVSTENSRGSSSDSDPVTMEIDMCDSLVMLPNDEDAMRTDSTDEEAIEPKTNQSKSTKPAKDPAGVNFAVQVKDMTSHLHEVSQIKANAYNSQATQYLLIQKFYDQLYTYEKRSIGTREAGWTPLDWNSRMKILLGVAKGIAHIPSIMGGETFHGNISSSNVLVTTDLQGRISDFAITSFFISSFKFFEMGYQPPEAIESRKLTRKSDVYSFSILHFEMLTGKSPLECKDLPSWDRFQAMDRVPIIVFDYAIRDIATGKGMCCNCT